MKHFYILIVICLSINSLFSKQKLETIIQTGQQRINSAAFTPNGKYIVTGSQNNNTVVIWDTHSGKQLRNINVGNVVYDIIIGGINEEIIITADAKGLLCYWDIFTGKKLKEINANYTARSKIALASNKNFIASGSIINNQNFVNIWDFNSGKKIKSFNTSDNVTCITFNSESNLIAVGLKTDLVQVWDIENETEIYHYTNIGKEISDVKFSSDNKYLAVGSFDGSLSEKNEVIKVYDIKTKQNISTIKPNIRQAAKFIFSPDDQSIILVKDNFDYDKSKTEIEWYNIHNGKLIKSIERSNSSNNPNLITISSDKKLLLGLNKIRDANSGELLQTLKKYEGHGNLKSINGIALNPLKKHLLTVGNANGTIQTWDLRMGKPINSINLQYNGSIIKYNANGKMLITGSRQANGIQFIDVRTLKPIKAFPNTKEYLSPYNFDLSKDEKILVSVSKKRSGSSSSEVAIWDTSTNQKIRVFKNMGNGSFNPIRLTHDAKHLIVTEERANLQGDNYTGALQIWEIDSGLKIKEFKTQNRISNILIAPDGKSFIYCDSKGKIWQHKTNSWEKIKEFQTKGNDFFSISKLIIAPDGNYIYVANYIDIEKYELSTGKLMATYKGHTDPITSLAINTDGTKLYSGDRLGKAKIWNTKESTSETATLIYLQGITDLKVNSIGTRGTRTAPKNSGAYLSRVIKDGPAYKAGMRNGDIITSFNGKNIAIATDYTNALLRGQKPGNKVKLTYKRGEQSFNSEVIIEQNVFKDRPTLKDDWAVILSDYHYMASKNIHKSVHFVKGMKYYNFENFDLMYNRPEVVIKRLGHANKDFLEMYQNAYNKRLNKMGFSNFQKIENLSFPEISIKKYNIPKETSATSVQIPVKAYSFKSNLDRLNVYVNDVPIYGTKGLSLKDKNIKDYQTTIEVKVSTGHNKIQFSVHDAAGFESIKETVEVNCTRPQKKPNLYIVSIGVSNYKDADFNLSYAAKDAKDLSAIFEQNSSFYSNIKTLNFLNEDATKDNILKAKQTLMQSSVDDEVILFVAGHGLLDDKLDYYFATNNIDFYNPSDKGLKYEELEGLLDGIPARKKLMLIDACHSGEVDKDADPTSGNNIVASNQNIESGTVKFRGFKNDNSSSLGLQNSFELMKELFADLRRGTGAMVISSASGAEFAYESDQWNNGVFTFSVLEALRNPNTDINYDGHIQISELRDYVTSRVTQLTGGRQHPTSRNENLDFDFSIW